MFPQLIPLSGARGGSSQCRRATAGSHPSLKWGSGIVTIAALAVVASTGLAAANTTTVVYQDNFSGSSSTSLAGQAPTVDNGTSSTWIQTWSAGSLTGTGQADSQPFFTANGAITGSLDSNGSSGALEVAGLNFTPQSGHIYTLTATMTPTNYVSGDSAYDGPLFMGFIAISGPSGTPTPFFNSDGPSMNTSGAPFVGGAFGPGQTNTFSAGSNPTLGETMEIILDTTGPDWQASAWYNPNGTGNGRIGQWGYGPDNGRANPTDITEVAIGANGASGNITSIELTDQAVPDPATLALFALGGTALALVRRKRSA